MRIFNFYLVCFTFYFIFSAPISFSLCLVTQSCPILWGPMDCSSVHGDSPGKNIGEGFHALLQVIFPTQGLNPGLLHCRQILYYLSHQIIIREVQIKATMRYLPTSQNAAATAKSLQSCPTLCDPIDGSPPGSPIPGILQARTLEWVAISFSNA